MTTQVDPVLSALGAQIKASRLAAGMTQEQAADAAEIDVKRWQRLEAGAANMTVRTLVRVAAAVGVSFWDLVRRAHNA